MTAESQDSKLSRYLSGFVTPARLKTFERILENRTKYLTVVLEDIYQSHNASAVLRSCDCFGIQDVHIIENKNKYTINPDVALGSSKWLTLTKYNRESYNTAIAFKQLRNNGYRIIATTPHADEVSVEAFDLTRGKAAFVFGTELTGLTEQAIHQADEYLSVPMFGFTESLNISVAAALILYHLTSRLRKSDLPWQLTPEEKAIIKLNWLKASVKNSDILIKEFLDNQD